MVLVNKEVLELISSLVIAEEVIEDPLDGYSNH